MFPPQDIWSSSTRAILQENLLIKTLETFQGHINSNTGFFFQKCFGLYVGTTKSVCFVPFFSNGYHEKNQGRRQKSIFSKNLHFGTFQFNLINNYLACMC